MNWEGLILDEETGRFTLRFAGGECRDLYAQVKLQDGTCLKTTDMKLHKKKGDGGYHRNRKLPQGGVCA